MNKKDNLQILFKLMTVIQFSLGAQHSGSAWDFGS